MSLLSAARDLEAELVALRRDLHRHPELAFQEHRTAELVADRVGELGFAVRTGVGRTGVVADLETGSPGPTVALRADMDALPIQEEGEHDYRSTVPGVMHACGHDAHTAGLVGAAHLLADARDDGDLPAGRVRLLFQPAEETVDEEGLSGASRMIRDGALEGVDAVVGLHVAGHLPTGRVFIREGTLMGGTEELRVVVRGRSSHVARPEEGVDALLLAAQGVVAAHHAVSRRLSPLESGTVAFGRIEGGSAPNVVADRVELHGTLRYLNTDVRDRLRAGVRDAFAMLEAQGARTEVTVEPGYPPVVNDPRVVGWVREAAAGVLGPDTVEEVRPMLTGEDFAFLASEVPGAFFWLGAALPDAREHHHPRFDIDEDVLPLGAALLVASATKILEAMA